MTVIRKIFFSGPLKIAITEFCSIPYATTFSLLGIHSSMSLDNINDLNYNIILPKIKFMIQQWNRRIQIPIGQVTIVKILILPELNHLFYFSSYS